MHNPPPRRSSERHSGGASHHAEIFIYTPLHRANDRYRRASVANFEGTWLNYATPTIRGSAFPVFLPLSLSLSEQFMIQRSRRPYETTKKLSESTRYIPPFPPFPFSLVDGRRQRHHVRFMKNTFDSLRSSAGRKIW